ncbi:MAG: hypothetical protein J5606_02830 [Bacteroidales bacterium]|nr:hypothetical protein [Bacteroidales bacterium]
MAIVICLLTVWLMMGLNRLTVLKNNEIIQAEIAIVNPQTNTQTLSFTYKGQVYSYYIVQGIHERIEAPSNKYLSKTESFSKKNVTLVIRHNNPEKYTIVNFTDFWLPAIIVALFCSLIVLLYFQVFHSKTQTIQLFFKRPLSDNK